MLGIGISPPSHGEDIVSITFFRILAVAIAIQFFSVFSAKAEGLKIKPALLESSTSPKTTVDGSWQMSDYVRSVGIDIYIGSTHIGSNKRGKPVEEGGLNEKNRGQAVVAVFNIERLCVWVDRCLDIVHGSYRTEFYLKLLGNIVNSNGGDTKHYGVGFSTLYTPQLSQSWRAIVGIGAERLHLNYCVPRLDACVDGPITIPYGTIGLEYVSKGLKIQIAPMKYLLPKGSTDKTQVVLRAYRLSAEIKFWGL